MRPGHHGPAVNRLRASRGTVSIHALRPKLKSPPTLWVVGLFNGGGDVQVVEQPDAIKCVLVRWNGVKFDLAHLARLRWIEKRTTPEICQLLGRSRSTVRASIRTLRKTGLSELNLPPEERMLMENNISREAAIYGGRYT